MLTTSKKYYVYTTPLFVMKQIELLDLILKALYETPGKSGEVVQLLKENNIKVSLEDAHRLGRRLADAGYVRFSPSRDSAFVDMKSEGIEFVEGDSFTHKGHPAITNNYTISNSSNANIINQSSRVSINQTDSSQAKQILERIKHEVSSDITVEEGQRNDVIDCTQEIEYGIASGRTPKFAIKSLLEMSSNISSIASLALQLVGLLP